jgi:quinol monooxygenase YgiN
VAVTVLADLHFQPEAVDGALEGLGKILPDTRSYEGCLGLDVIQDQADPNHVMLVETWESADHHKAYVAWRVETGTLAELAAVVTQDPTFTYFDRRTDL